MLLPFNPLADLAMNIDWNVILHRSVSNKEVFQRYKEVFQYTGRKRTSWTHDKLKTLSETFSNIVNDIYSSDIDSLVTSHSRPCTI